MTGWTTTTLGEVVALQRGIDTTKATQLPGAVPVVSSSGISSYRSDAWAEGPGVIMGRKGTLGHVHYIEGSYWPHDTTLWVTDFKGNNAKFIYYFLKQLETSSMNVGSASPTLNRNHLYPLPVFVPPQKEQQAIAEVLGALDDKIAANGKLARACETLMSESITAMALDAQLSDLVTLAKEQLPVSVIATMTVDHYSLPAFDGRQLPLQESGAGIRSNKFRLAGASVLLSKLNPRFPRVWNVPRPGRNAVASTEFLVLEPVDLPSAAVWALLATSRTTAYLVEHAAGTSGSHQRVRPADALRIPMPSRAQFSERMLDQLVGLGDRTLLAREESRTLAQLRDTLLPALMDGRLRVRDAIEQVEGAI